MKYYTDIKYSECIYTHPHANAASKEINQSVSRATEIHIMWLLSYSTLIKLVPVTSQGRGETAVSAEGQEEEENDSLTLCVYESLCMRAPFIVIELLHDIFPFWLILNNAYERS